MKDKIVKSLDELIEKAEELKNDMITAKNQIESSPEYSSNYHKLARAKRTALNFKQDLTTLTQYKFSKK